jgi:thiaminase
MQIQRTDYSYLEEVIRGITMTASTRSSKEMMTKLCTIVIFMIHQVGNNSREDTSGIDIGACNSMIIT